jgi:hypothetical protein
VVFQGFVLATTVASHTVGLELSLDVPDRVYVPREPVLLRVTLCNESMEWLDLVDVEDDEYHGNRFFLEVTSPAGAASYHRLTARTLFFGWSNDEVFRGAYHRKHFEGRLLGPGDGLSACFEIGFAAMVDRPGVPGRDVGQGFAFDEAGRYRVRVVFVVPHGYEDLWPNGYGELVSNWVDVEIREALPGEQVALDEFWAPVDFGCGATGERIRRLRRLLLDYERLDIAPHFYLALVEELTRSANPWRRDDFDDAMALLEIVRAEHPAFDPERTATLLARAYYYRDEREKAVALLDSLVQADPRMLNHFNVKRTINLVTSDVVLSLDTDADEYALGEPVRFTLTMVDRGDAPVGIEQPYGETFLTDNIRFEMRYPDGRVEICRYLPRIVVCTYGISNPGSPGTPLAPGDSIRWHMDPVSTLRLHHPDSPRPHPREHVKPRRMFPVVGSYRIRAIYSPRSGFDQMWFGPDGELRSAPVTVKIVDATPSQRVVLDALSTRHRRYRFSERSRRWIPDDVEGWTLRNAIATSDPSEQMLRYAYFELARHYLSLLDEYRWTESAKAVPILEMLTSRHPDFRYGEVRCLLVRALVRSGRMDEARGILRDLIRERPTVLNSKEGQRALWHAEMIDPDQAVQWDRSRRSVWWQQHAMFAWSGQ